MFLMPGSLLLKTLSFVFCVQALINQSFAEELCSYQWETVHAVEYQNISVLFHLKEPLSVNDTFNWIEPASTSGKMSSRYKLKNRFDQTDFELIIHHAEEKDSGTHHITLFNGTTVICTALILELTVVSGSPNCTTYFRRENHTMQMTCERLHGLKGDLAQLLTENRVLYEHEVTTVNLRNQYTLPHKFSVFPDIQDVIRNKGVPSKCVISNERMNVRKMCTFPPIEHHTIHYHQDDVLIFDCRVKNGSIPLSWWDNADTSLSPISAIKSYIITEGEFVVFLCMKDVSHSLMKLHRMIILHFQEKRYNISVSAEHHKIPGQGNDFIDNAISLTITVDGSVVALPFSTSTTTQAPSAFLKSQDNDSSSNCVVSEETNATDVVSQMKTISMETMLLTVLALSTIAHGVSIIAFVFSYRNADEYDVRKRD